jgi:hypothetical protein
MASKILHKVTPQKETKTAVKASKKPMSERRTKIQRLLGQELDAHYVEVGLMACEDVRCIWLALNALMLILLFQGDETQERIGNLMRLPVRRLGVIVKEFPDLGKARHKLEQLNAQTRAIFDKRKKGGAR